MQADAVSGACGGRLGAVWLVTGHRAHPQCTRQAATDDALGAGGAGVVADYIRVGSCQYRPVMTTG